MSTSTLEIKALPDSVRKPSATKSRRAPSAATKKGRVIKKSTKTNSTAPAPATKVAIKTPAKAKATPKKTAGAKKKTPNKAKVAKPQTVKKTTSKAAKKRSPRKVTPKATVKQSTKSAPTATASAATLKRSGALGIKRHPLGHLLLEQKLHEAGFKGGISTNKHLLERYSTDESIFSIKPQVVLQPKTPEDIGIAAMLIAAETKHFSSLSLTPRAAGTGLSGGSLTDSVVIDVCAHLKHISNIKHHKEEVHITVEPGVMWRDMEVKLKRTGFYVPSYPSSKDIASVGGAVGNNSAGGDTLRYGHCADWVNELDIVLHDGNTYTVKAITYTEYKKLSKKKDAYSTIIQNLFNLIEMNETEIKKNRPKIHKNTAGYNLWDVIPQGVTDFKKGKGTLNPIKLIAGSQGTIGIVSNITMRAIPLPHHTTLMVVPIFDLQEVAQIINKAKTYNPLEMEIFDDLAFDLALQNPQFFKRFGSGLTYYRSMFSLYTMYHLRFQRNLPEFFIMINLDEETTRHTPAEQIARTISSGKARARIVANPVEEEILWQVYRSSYNLSKLQSERKRPAAFLEDMTIPIEQLPKFLTRIKALLKEFNIRATVHGHAGDGHLHFYPLLDFTNKTTPALIMKMSEKFFKTAIDCGGNICGEHNDGIIRTTNLSKLFTKQMLRLFSKVEALFDPDDIFNPGKKVNPRFDIKSSIRHTN